MSNMNKQGCQNAQNILMNLTEVKCDQIALGY